jgi:SprT protein
MNHISVTSSNVASIGYDKATKTLEVKFKQGRITTYPDMPEHVYFHFLIAPNKDEFFKAHLAYGPEQSDRVSSNIRMPSRNAHLESTAETSWLRCRDYLPERAHKFIKSLLSENPTEVIPVRMRLRKRGDYHCRPIGGTHKITINKCGNPYQFLITLIHELAHARARKDNGSRIRPHGQEWRVTFSAFLHRSLGSDCFPEDLLSGVQDFAFSPTATSSNDLEEALRSYDTLDKPPLVSELPDGTLFSQGRGYIMHKGGLRGETFRCEAFDGTTYMVPASSRVFATYAAKGGKLELISDYKALTEKLADDFEALEQDKQDEYYFG